MDVRKFSQNPLKRGRSQHLSIYASIFLSTCILSADLNYRSVGVPTTELYHNSKSLPQAATRFPPTCLDGCFRLRLHISVFTLKQESKSVSTSPPYGSTRCYLRKPVRSARAEKSADFSGTDTAVAFFTVLKNAACANERTCFIRCEEVRARAPTDLSRDQTRNAKFNGGLSKTFPKWQNYYCLKAVS